MQEQWFREYVLLAFRMDQTIRKCTESRFVDYYYGPPEWEAAANAEAERTPSELVRDAMALEDALASQGFEAHRATYLAKQVVALETLCRKLNGETFSLEEEVLRYLVKYSLLPDEEALRYVEFLKVPFQQAYIFTYFYGRQLMKPWLQGPERWNTFRRFLTEQVYPSELVKETTEPGEPVPD